MIFIGGCLLVVAAVWFIRKVHISYTSAGGTDFEMPVFDAAVYPPILTAVGLYLVLSSNDISWSVWIYVAIWAGTTAVAAGVIKLAGVWGDKPL